VIYELRSHDIVPESMEEYLSWISQHGLPVMRRFGFRMVGPGAGQGWPLAFPSGHAPRHPP